MQKVNLSDGRVGPGLDLGWTMMYLPDKLHKIDNYSLITN